MQQIFPLKPHRTLLKGTASGHSLSARTILATAKKVVKGRSFKIRFDIVRFNLSNVAEVEARRYVASSNGTIQHNRLSKQIFLFSSKHLKAS